jgi:hypothetical protein
MCHFRPILADELHRDWQFVQIAHKVHHNAVFWRRPAWRGTGARRGMPRRRRAA